MQITMDKKYKLKHGFNFKANIVILSVDGPDPDYPVTGHLEGSGRIRSWTLGGVSSDRGTYDLIELTEGKFDDE